MTMHVELQAACSALGYQEGNTYVKEPDCIETVKDLIRFLKREDDTCDVRRQLCHAQVIQRDLLPILVHYEEEEALWETVIRLLVNLTQPAFLCFNSFIPEEKTLRHNYLDLETHLQNMKEAFANEDVFAVITKKLGDLLKLDWEHRHEEHRLLIERVLILIRNVLHIPPNPDAEQRTDDDASVHDQVLWAMHVSGLEDILLYIASSEEERNLSMHMLEIVSLMFREQSAEMLASAGGQRSISEKEKDERELEQAREQEKLEKKAHQMKVSSRHPRFGGTFVVKNFKSISENDLIYHKSKCEPGNINLDQNKRPKKKAKNRKPIIDREVKRRSTLSIRLGLREFCIQFLENCYNPLMYAVKDVLNREKSQEHDETYYLWAIRFFMEFCRLHSGQVDLVSETMSVQTFHYIQVQLFQYYEMITMEKKEAISWGKRAHLALKAYQELLLTLDSMDRSGNSNLMESSRVVKSNIFYMMEFRDIFLTLLRHFKESTQSRAYLKDLIETTHLFLKMLEAFSKNTGHLIVQRKKKKSGRRKKQPVHRAPSGHVEPSQQELDDLWDEVSGELSAIFQGRADVPTDVTPFDAASEVDVDQQRADAMIRIQDAIRNKQAGEAVALLRAAREVWPERNEFGSADISPEDEFMAVREIFMTELPRANTEVPGVVEEEQGGEEDEEEEQAVMVTSEQEFVFREFVVKFAKPDILKAYVLLVSDFKHNSTHTNHCCVKMLHRVAVDLHYIGMVFQASLFRVFQKILNTPLARSSRYKELAKFGAFVVRNFVEVASNNRKAFMELLFWKTNKEAIEIVEGYGSYQSKGKVTWTEDAEMEVRRLFEEYNEEPKEGQDTVDCIMEHMTDPTKTRGQIITELKKQELIKSAKELKKPKIGMRSAHWREEELLELRELYEKHCMANDPVGEIMSEMVCRKRSRPKLIEKILSMGLTGDRRDLYKKRGGKPRTKRGHGAGDSDDDRELPSDFDDEDADSFPRLRHNSDSDDGGSSSSSVSSTVVSDISGDEGPGQEVAGSDNMADILRNLVAKGYKDQIAWIQRNLNRTASDKEEEDENVSVPLVPLTEENETAMEDSLFLDFLEKLGLASPADEQEIFWRIPAGLSPAELRNLATGLTLDESGEPVHADKIQVKHKPVQKKRKKEKKKKEPIKKKNADKFSKLKELVKKKAAAKSDRRNRKKRFSGPQEEESLPVSESEQGEIGEPASAKKKKRRVRNIAASDSSDSDEEMPLSSLGRATSPGSAEKPSTSRSPLNQSASKTKSRLKRMVDSSDSNSDEDIPLRSLTALPVSDESMVRDTDAGTQSQEEETRTQSQSQEADSQSQDSQPLLLLSSSDDDSDMEKDGEENNDVAGTSKSASKRSRSLPSGSDVDVSQEKKRARLADSDSDDDDDKPLSSVVQETFPATLYTQGPESDSDLDDHVTLKKVIQKKRNAIESDSDE
ncbi:protein timeless homolog isoform X2 [Mya arenaria]|uniref:protein timeless homolog isoform X2 n=1 Tax=Mya arenaria TaxID=6604 RepID=UPI0022E25E55|nr:protein timeless homolog isoform X2 [Mya arenaria]